MNRIWYVLLCSSLLLAGISAKAQNNEICPDQASLVNETMNRITEVIVHDVFTPPVASRIYAYTAIAGYSAYHFIQGETPFTVKLNEFPELPLSSPNQPYCASLAMSSAMFETAKALLFSEAMVDSSFTDFTAIYFEDKLDEKTRQTSINYGRFVASQVIEWAGQDNYRETRSLERYTPEKLDDSWEPTPPDNADAVEPYWGRMRPFVLDSASQCQPIDPPAYSEDPSSRFYLDAMEVFDTKTTLTADQEATVFFWDDNPFVTVHTGHLVYAKKKVSPAGHWMGITEIAINQSGADLDKAIEAYTMVSIGLADAFISCWEEKYRSNLIRPVTYINRVIDPNWEPFLQTPPFPEYTSGHSVISASASMILTELFGDGFAYTDDVLEKYGQPPRSYKSFLDAANEAAYSRLYGGIHYRPAIEVGVQQGRKVASIISAELL